MTNVFSSQPFLDSLAAARFPGEPSAIQMFRAGGHDFRLLVVRGRPVVTVPWLDFHEPQAASSPDAAAPRALGYLPRVALRTVSSAEWQEAAGAAPSPGMPSPYIDWTVFPTYADFERRNPSQASSSRRRWRQLLKEHSLARYTFQDDDPAAFEQCIEWKRAQYRASGFGDALADPANRQLLHELRDRGLLIVSTLRGGEAVLAAHIGMLWEGRLYWWIPSYDQAHARFSPGRLLLEKMIEDSHGRGHREFDFLLGDESYKWLYATHARVVDPLGTPPLALRARRLARWGIKRALQLSPGLWDAAQRIRRRLRSA